MSRREGRQAQDSGHAHAYPRPSPQRQKPLTKPLEDFVVSSTLLSKEKGLLSRSVGTNTQRCEGAGGTRGRGEAGTPTHTKPKGANRRTCGTNTWRTGAGRRRATSPPPPLQV